MRLAAYRSPAPLLVSFPGTRSPVGLAPLPPQALDDAYCAAVSRLAWQGLEARGRAFELELMVQVLARALRQPCPPWRPLADVTALRSALDPYEVVELWDRWRSAQQQSMPRADALRRELRRAVVKDAAVTLDGLRAHQAADAAAYYGRPASMLTDGQIAYYITLLDVFREIHVDRPNTLINAQCLS